MKLATRTMRARYCSWCPLCRSPILTGQFISLTSIWAHTSCIIEQITSRPGARGSLARLNT